MEARLDVGHRVGLYRVEVGRPACCFILCLQAVLGFKVGTFFALLDFKSFSSVS